MLNSQLLAALRRLEENKAREMLKKFTDEIDEILNDEAFLDRLDFLDKNSSCYEKGSPELHVCRDPHGEYQFIFAPYFDLLEPISTKGDRKTAYAAYRIDGIDGSRRLCELGR